MVPLSRRGDSQAVSANERNPTALSLAKERRRLRSEGGVSVSDDGQDRRSRDMVSSLGRQHLIALPFAVSIEDGPVGVDELCLLLDPNAVDRAIHAGRRVTLAGRNARLLMLLLDVGDRPPRRRTMNSGATNLRIERSAVRIRVSTRSHAVCPSLLGSAHPGIRLDGADHHAVRLDQLVLGGVTIAAADADRVRALGYRLSTDNGVSDPQFPFTGLLGQHINIVLPPILRESA